MVGYVFLASPYTHPLREERERRFHAAERACVHYLAKGTAIYSPIVHWHNIALQQELPYDYLAWQKVNDPLIENCRAFYILEIDGWLKSLGVQHEIEVALASGKPCYVVSPWKQYSARLLKDVLA